MAHLAVYALSAFVIGRCISHWLHRARSMTHQTIIAPRKVVCNDRRVSCEHFRLWAVTPKARDVGPFGMIGRHVGDRLHRTNLMAHEAVVATSEIVRDILRSYHLRDSYSYEKTH